MISFPFILFIADKTKETRIENKTKEKEK